LRSCGVFSPRLILSVFAIQLLSPAMLAAVNSQCRRGKELFVKHLGESQLNGAKCVAHKKHVQSASQFAAQSVLRARDVSVCSEQSAQKVHKSPASGVAVVVDGCILAKTLVEWLVPQ
jgi:hypothetical protein